ncbi:MAG TPA: carboxypeptidase regulatory-like domain-containing protein [Terriglobales bacterium]|nr:carboxypeptidase regulatory-like domain-containing protein [Terriglobales bacterium]
MQRLSSILRFIAIGVALLTAGNVFGQTLATVQGQVTDPSGAVIPGATVTVTNTATSVSQTAKTDSSGNYRIPALPIGTYDVEVQASGLERQRAKSLILEVGRTSVQNFQLKIAQASEVVTVESEIPVVESTTMTVGQVMDPKNVQQIPLNGRHFVDLGFLIPGSVTPPSNGFLAQPIRGQGSLAFNTAGQREDTVNFMVNGINLADMGNGQITFQPAISTLDEFKVDNSTYSADEGRNSGAIVNMATRSGTNQFHGEAFDFMRNNYFDARNFFNKVGVQQSQFIRNNFGGAVGGPIIKNKLFFFGAYEGLRQRQGLTLSTTVLNAAQRNAALASSDATVRQLVPLIPQANDSTGSKFLGSASAPVKLDQWTGDISYNVSDKDRVHGYYALQKDVRTEPTDAGAGSTVPGYGDQRVARRQLFTLNESHVFSPNVVNEARLGFNRIHITFQPVNNLDPTKFGINNGRSGPVGIPEIFVQSIGLDFGGVSGFPQGRGDLTSVLSDSVTYLRAKHSFKFGWEGRQVNDNGTFSHDIGFVQFSNPTDFINGNASLYTNGGDVSPHVIQRALSFFAMDSYKVASYLTLELGLRYEWNMTPFEKDNRQSEFLPATATLVQVGTSALPLLYQQNNKNFEPRLGFAWDVFHNGKTVVRSGYGWAVDQPLPLQLNGNPPFATASRFSTTTAKPFTTFATLASDAAASGASVSTVDQNYKNAYVQSYNFNIQQEITPSTAVMIGYFGSKGTHLRQNINLNQPFYTNTSTGAQSRPFPSVAANSPIAPNLTLGTSLTDRVSNGNSNYNALWVTGTRRLAAGLQFSANYTWSKSLDYASQTGAAVPENSLSVRQDYGLSDFDARNRFVFTGLYELPFKANRLVEGWRVSGVLTLQSGNPLNILAGAPIAGPAGSGIPVGSSTLFTGVATNRVDQIAPVSIVNQIITSGTQAGNILWLSPICDPRFGACASGSSFALPVQVVNGVNIYHFGNVRRNSVLGPDFKNLDFSLAKTTRLTERLRLELRAEAFDLFNHPNFGNPNRTAVTSAGNTFGVISSTRFPNGDSGSSRQLQFAAKMIF